MFEQPQRQHPVAALTSALGIIRANFFTIIIILFVGNVGDGGSLNLYWILGAFVSLLGWGVITWMRFTFSVNDGKLNIEQGVWVHKKLTLTTDRIQVIDITAGVVQRIFGLVAVEIKTAGSSSKQAKIDALSRKQAEQLKELLRANRDEADTPGNDLSKSTVKTYSLKPRDLIIAASTSGRMGVALSIVGGAFSQIDQFFTEEQMVNFVQQNMPRSTSLSLIIMGVIAVIAISWLFSFVSTVILNYDFSVEVREEDLLISKGLFERKQQTIPFNRIQAVQIKEGLLRQPFGYASLVIESAGYGKDEGNSNTLFPLISKHRLAQFIKEVIPEYDTESDQCVEINKAGMRRYLLRMVWVSLIIIGICWGMVPYGVYSWFILIPMLLLGYQQYRDAEVCTGEQTLIMRSRLLKKRTAIIKRYRLQASRIKQNPFQSRLGLSDVIVHVASGNQGRSFKVREVKKKHALSVNKWVSN